MAYVLAESSIATHRNTLQHTATHCNTLKTLQHGYVRWTEPSWRTFYTAVVHTIHRKTLQHTENTATHCNTLQQGYVRWTEPSGRTFYTAEVHTSVQTRMLMADNTLESGIICCSVLQYVAVSCSAYVLHGRGAHKYVDFHAYG